MSNTITNDNLKRYLISIRQEKEKSSAHQMIILDDYECVRVAVGHCMESSFVRLMFDNCNRCGIEIVYVLICTVRAIAYLIVALQTDVPTCGTDSS